jgi:hypothetical protein
MPSATDRTDLVALVEELVEAHLDTIEMGLEFGHEWGSHVLYLQALVRQSHACLAGRGGVAGGPPPRHLIRILRGRRPSPGRS